MEQMVSQGFTDNLIITLDADGALLATRAGEKFHAHPPKTEVISHVGAGDSFVSVLVHQLDSGKTVIEAFAMAWPPPLPRSIHRAISLWTSKRWKPS